MNSYNLSQMSAEVWHLEAKQFFAQVNIPQDVIETSKLEWQELAWNYRQELLWRIAGIMWGCKVLNNVREVETKTYPATFWYYLKERCLMRLSKLVEWLQAHSNNRSDLGIKEALRAIPRVRYTTKETHEHWHVCPHLEQPPNAQHHISFLQMGAPWEGSAEEESAIRELAAVAMELAHGSSDPFALDNLRRKAYRAECKYQHAKALTGVSGSR